LETIKNNRSFKLARISRILESYSGVFGVCPEFEIYAGYQTKFRNSTRTIIPDSKDHSDFSIIFSILGKISVKNNCPRFRKYEKVS